jgi:hypothetical protein
MAFAFGCQGGPAKIELYADGFDPELVSFNVEDLGLLTDAALVDMGKRPEIDGALRLPKDVCDPCRVAQVSVYVTNKSREPAAPPVVRLAAPKGRPSRNAIAFTGGEVSPGRTGRIRWLVALYPEEKALTATVSSSVFLDVTSSPPPPPSNRVEPTRNETRP